MAAGGRMAGDGAGSHIELRLAALEIAGVAMHAGPAHAVAVARRLAIDPVAGRGRRGAMHASLAVATQRITVVILAPDARARGSRAQPVHAVAIGAVFALHGRIAG